MKIFLLSNSAFVCYYLRQIDYASSEDLKIYIVYTRRTKNEDIYELSSDLKF